VHRDEDPNVLFAMACTWHGAFSIGTLDVANPRVMQGYYGHAGASGLPFFILVGVGGVEHAPKDLYIIPLEQAKRCILTHKEIQPFRQSMRWRSFHFDPFSKALLY
jgi:hypothetical protein